MVIPLYARVYLSPLAIFITSWQHAFLFQHTELKYTQMIYDVQSYGTKPCLVKGTVLFSLTLKNLLLADVNLQIGIIIGTLQCTGTIQGFLVYFTSNWVLLNLS